MMAGQARSCPAPNGCEAVRLHVSCWSELDLNGSNLRLRAEASRPAASAKGRTGNGLAGRRK